MDQPVQALDLILAHLAKLDDRWLHCQAVTAAGLVLVGLIGEQLGILCLFVLLVVPVPRLLPRLHDLRPGPGLAVSW